MVCGAASSVTRYAGGWTGRRGLADAFLATQPCRQNLDRVAFTGKIKAAKPDPTVFQYCVTAMDAAPGRFRFIDDREGNVRAAQAIGRAGRILAGLGAL